MCVKEETQATGRGTVRHLQIKTLNSKSNDLIYLHTKDAFEVCLSRRTMKIRFDSHSPIDALAK
jgi:hypothetical protein